MAGEKAFVLCTGCPESRIDSRRVENFLTENGWAITPEIKEADLILFRSCGLTNEHVEGSIQIIKKLKAEKNRDAQLIVWGCLPKSNRDALKSVYHGISFGEKEADVLDRIIEAKKPISKVTANSCLPVFKLQRSGQLNLFERILDFFFKDFSIAKESIFQIKVSTGCLHNCSFCNVRKSRGAVNSKSIDDVVAEFRGGLAKGFRCFGLLATDLGAYGRDQGNNLVDLLTELTKEKGDYRIGLRNINPYHLIEMFDDLKPFFASGKIWFLSFGVESGSNRILKLMNRRYKIQDVIKCIRILNREYQDILLRTQLIVGFPTETNEDFQMTKKLINEFKFDWIEVYKFSPNSGTAAAEMDSQIPDKLKIKRYRQVFVKNILQHPFRKIKQIVTMRMYHKRQI